MSTSTSEVFQSAAATAGESDLDARVARLAENKTRWARTPVSERIDILEQIRHCLMEVAEDWAETAAEKKQIPKGSPLVGEEWTSGPYALMTACNALKVTLSQLDGKTFLDDLDVRSVRDEQIAIRVVPHTIWDRLLLSGVKADVWMKEGVKAENLRQHAAPTYDVPRESRTGSVSLVLGAGNIAAIAPLDCFQMLFVEHSVVMLKLNPVNDYLQEFLQRALRPLIDFGSLEIVSGGADVGEYLCNHPDIETIHITGAGASHDAIVWGTGETAERNRQANTPRNPRRISSELGAVCPTIVVPGPWTKADIRFQAENVATQKLHNSGFNCVACQMLVMPEEWSQGEQFRDALVREIENAPKRGLYYPGANDRIDEFLAAYPDANVISAGDTRRVVVQYTRERGNDLAQETEVFAPVLNVTSIGGENAERFLRAAIDYCNEELYGTLGANIIIHPATRREIGDSWNEIIGELKYGCIAVNAWTGVGFLTAQAPWGAFPGHTLQDVQSGIGFVHNTYMLDNVERSVVEAPFRPFPRNLMHGSFSLLPRPPWFVTNKRAHVVGKLMTRFQYKPGWLKLPRIFLNALMG